MISNQLAPRFLSLDEVLILHRIAVEDSIGEPALRERPLLESALAMPQQQFGGQTLHGDIPSMAAAYAVHLCMNHPFVDGNKRVALASRFAFLAKNDRTNGADESGTEEKAPAPESGALGKVAFTDGVRARDARDSSEHAQAT